MSCEHVEFCVVPAKAGCQTAARGKVSRSIGPATAGRLDIPFRRITIGLLAVAVMQVLFALSYLGAFHNPKPHELPVAVAAPSPSVAAGTASDLLAAAGGPGRALEPRAVDSPAQARAQVRDRTADGAFVVGTKGDQLLVASAGGPAVSSLLATQFRALEAKQKRQLTVADLAPLPAADSRGLTPFYLSLVMVFGGYLGVTVLSLVTGPTAHRGRVAALRLGGLMAYAIVSSVAVVLAIRVAFGVLDRHEVQAVVAAAAICFATCATAVTVQALLGTIGTGLVILLFVVVGNPAAGGAVPYGLLPQPYRGIGPYLVNGAGVDLIRNLTYFGGRSISHPLLVLGVWAVLASGVALTLSAARFRRLSAAEMELAPAAAGGL